MFRLLPWIDQISNSVATRDGVSQARLVVGAMASRPVGGVLSSASRRLGDHPSMRPTSGVSVPKDRRTGRSSPTFGLAPGGVCRAIEVTPDAGALLPHRFTLTCARRPSAVCSLWHFPAGRPDWPLASTLPGGAPTFLRTVAVCTAPNRGHPSDSPSPAQCRTVSDEPHSG